MPNLVGIGLSQVPTNSMLGGMAYQDPEHASIKNLDLKDLAQINSEIANTASHVFLYDTSKDSDGGAWRYRTQHTSWYNETLGTEYRGTRKEFPAVAVIVSRTGYLDIYDGDDPNLPLWMGWKQNSSMLRSHENGTAHALNGIIALSNANTYGGLITIDMIGDGAKSYRAIGSNNNSEGLWLGNIAYRNTPTSNNFSNASGGASLAVLARENTTNVDMAVMPNAPIDPATGLPTPTIVVATNGGTSMLKPDGNIYDFNDALGSPRPVDFSVIRGNDIVHWNVNNGTMQQFFDALSNTADSISDVKYNYSVGGGHGTCENFSALLRNSGEGPFRIVAKDSKSIVAGANSGVSMFVDGLDRNFSTNNNSIEDSRVAHITSTYNTGWQYGDVNGTFLSGVDTTATESDSPEFIVGGDFSNASDWSLGTGWSINGSGQAVHSGSAGYLTQATSGGNNFVQGRWYQLLVDVVSGNGSSFGIVNHHDTSINQPHTGNAYADVYIVQSGNKGMALWKQSGNNLNNINLYSNGSVTIDAVSIKEITEEYYDRSLKEHHLLRYGTITRSAVATGAELIAYSGWSDSNFLRQAYNADLNYGTGDFSVMGWIKMPDVSQLGFIFDRASLTTSGGGPRIAIYAESSQLKFYTFDGSSNTEESTSLTGYNNQWVCFVCNRLSNGNQEMYINGELKDSRTGTSRDVSNTASPVTTIGHRYNAAAGATTANIFEGSIALLRTSASIPTADQVRDMYEQEKSLFYENAQATLYGTSSNVKAIAYDEKTKMIHIGTASGRSDFQGLRRINNTTTAVTTSISAHDGFIVEQ